MILCGASGVTDSLQIHCMQPRVASKAADIFQCQTLCQCSFGVLKSTQAVLNANVNPYSKLEVWHTKVALSAGSYHGHYALDRTMGRPAIRL